MRTRKIRFTNRSCRTFYIFLKPDNGRLEINIHDKPAPGRDCVMSRQRITVLLSPSVDECIVDGNLQFTVIGHCNGPMMQFPTEADPDGPEFVFIDADA